jgi:hypothetical protein
VGRGVSYLTVPRPPPTPVSPLVSYSVARWAWSRPNNSKPAVKKYIWLWAGPLYPRHIPTESEVKPAVKAGRDLATLVSYLMVPHPLPTPAPPLVGEPIVEVYNIKTYNFYEIKVDF